MAYIRRALALALFFALCLGSVSPLSAKAAPHTEPEDLIVVLVSFSDAPITTPDSYWENLIFGEGVNSVNDYYKENSNGQCYFKPVKLSGNTTGIYSVTIEDKFPLDSEWESRQREVNDYGQVVKALSEQGVDLFSLDRNSDGVISSTETHTAFIFATRDPLFGGFGTYYFPAYSQRGYSMPPELKKGIDVTIFSATGFLDHNSLEYTPETIGAFCHELGHSLGLPDLYRAINRDDSLGMLSLMADGGHGYTDGYSGACPTHFDAWSKIQLGWYEPVTADTLKLYPATAPDKYNVLKIPIRGMSSQYYLVERRKAESFDAPLVKGVFLNYEYKYSDFVIVWHVDMSVINGVMEFPNARERRGLSAIAIVPPGGSVSADELLYYRSKDIFASGKTKSGYSLTVSGDFEVSVTYDDPFDGSGLIVQGMNTNGEDAAGFTINMDTERITVPDGERITDYYYTSGTKWVKFKSDDMSKIFEKNNGGFKIAKKSDTNQIDLESIVSFGDIAARPKLKNIAINYSLCADPTGATTGAWTLTQKNSTATLTGIELATSKDKKNPDIQDDGSTWFPLEDEGIPVLPYGSAKQTYLARTPPRVEYNEIVPASKPIKLTPKTMQKATKVKANYKKELIKIKGIIFGGDMEALKATRNEPVWATSTSAFAPGLYYEAQKSDKAGVPLTAVLDKTDTGVQSVCIWIPATDKKPATQVQEYKLAVRAELPSQVLAGTNGRVSLPKTFEVYNAARGKWGSLPRFTASVVLEDAVRLKSTARATGIDDSSQTAASKPVDLTVEYGVYTPADARTAKSGVLSVSIGAAET